MSDIIQHKVDIIGFIECINGNPNGDPDAGGAPRYNYSTNKGIMTDVSIKRKIRNAVELMHSGEPGMKLYIQNDASLNSKDSESYVELGVSEKEYPTYRKSHPDANAKLKQFMCENYWDLRAFGGVMTSFAKHGIGGLTGPVQIAISDSINEVELCELSTTRVAITTDADYEAGKRSTFAPKTVFPYALFQFTGTIMPHEAERTGFTEDDQDILFEAMKMMCELDRAVMRANMSVRALWAVKHKSKFGDCHSWQVHDAIKVEPCEEVAAGKRAPNKFQDYTITLNEAELPDTLEIIRLV